MKKIKILFYLLMFLPIVVSVISIFFLPNTIPAHFNEYNEVTRYGSKYEVLIMPIFTVAFGYFMLAIGKIAVKAENTNNSNNKKLVYIFSSIALLVFNVITFYFLYVDFNRISSLDSVKVDISSLIYTVCGICFIIIGNFMPKAKKNGIIGVRTRWNIYTEKSWKMCQRFGGIVFVIAGFILIIGNSFMFSGLASNIYSILLMIIMTIVICVYAYNKRNIENKY